MKGNITITTAMVNSTIGYYGENQLFKLILRGLTDNFRHAGWYAKKLENNMYVYYWSEGYYKPSYEHLKALKKDGYELAYNIYNI